MRVLLLDNYDSFTWNVADLAACAGATVDVVRNDAVTVAQALDSAHDAIIISPGPGRPEDAGVSMELVAAAIERSIPLLGICLGMQCIGAASGARVKQLGRVIHGAASPITHDGRGIYAAVPARFEAARYHSLVVEEGSLPASLAATAHAEDDGALMGIRHAAAPVEGVQFHPESILTEHGDRLMRRFLDLAAAHARARAVEVAS